MRVAVNCFRNSILSGVGRERGDEAVDRVGDVLLGSDKSVLLLGEPGSGKTTLLRDVARILAVDNNVAVVDTSSEIAGDGSIAHDCIGLARRSGLAYGWASLMLRLGDAAVR